MEGICLVNAMHITALVFINDDEGGLHHDFEVWLEELAPHEPVKNTITIAHGKTKRTPISNARSCATRKPNLSVNLRSCVLLKCINDFLIFVPTKTEYIKSARCKLAHHLLKGAQIFKTSSYFYYRRSRNSVFA